MVMLQVFFLSNPFSIRNYKVNTVMVLCVATIRNNVIEGNISVSYSLGNSSDGLFQRFLVVCL